MADAELLSPTAALSRVFVFPRAGDEAAAEAVHRYGFRIGSTRFLHDLSLGVELVDVQRCFELPNAGEGFSGLVNLRGNLVPVFDLKPLLGEEAAAVDKQMLLVIGTGDRAAALVIDGNPMRVTLDAGERVGDLSRVPELVRERLRGAYAREGVLWIEPDYEALFESLAERGGT